MADIQKIVEELSKLTVQEAVELSKALEETWGVSPYGCRYKRSCYLFR